MRWLLDMNILVSILALLSGIKIGKADTHARSLLQKNTYPDPSQYPTNSPTKYPTLEPTLDPTEDNGPVVETTDSGEADDPAVFITTFEPTLNPTLQPSNDPTLNPTLPPSNDPTVNPTINPTSFPSIDPTKNPSNDPTDFQTINPTQDPSINPTDDPTLEPTSFPIDAPTLYPTQRPTKYPTTRKPTKYAWFQPKYASYSEYNQKIEAKYWKKSKESSEDDGHKIEVNVHLNDNHDGGNDNDSY